MTTLEVANAVDADEFAKGYMTADRKHRTIEDAENAVEDSPFLEAIRKRQDMRMKFWDKRGTNPVEANLELAD